MKNFTPANKITLSRMLLVIPTAICYILANVLRFRGENVYLGLLIAATVIFAICCITDFIDGYVARRYNCVSDLGKFLDPVVDKVNIAVVLFLAVCFNDGLYEVYAFNNVVIAVLGGLIMARELLIGMFRALAAKKGAVIPSDMTGKIKTVFLNVSAIVMLLAGVHKVFAFISTILFYIGAALTVISGVHYVLKNRDILNDGDSIVENASNDDTAENASSGDEVC